MSLKSFPFHLTSLLSSAVAPVSFFRATYGPADGVTHAVDLFSDITRHMACANIHFAEPLNFQLAFPRIIILFVHSYRERIGIMTYDVGHTSALGHTSSRPEIRWITTILRWEVGWRDVRTGNTVIVAERFGGSGEVESAPFHLLEVSRIP